MPIPGIRVDPLVTQRFSIEVEGILFAAFSECSGLQAEVDVFPYEEGGVNDYVHKLPGRAKFSNLTLKRGIAFGNSLWEWFAEVAKGKVKRRNISVVLYTAAYLEMRRWNFIRAYPVKWVGPTFKAGENAISIETLELAHTGMSAASTPERVLTTTAGLVRRHATETASATGGAFVRSKQSELYQGTTVFT